MLRHFSVNTICNISKIPTLLNINSKQRLQTPINFYKYFHLPPLPPHPTIIQDLRVITLVSPSY